MKWLPLLLLAGCGARGPAPATRAAVVVHMERGGGCFPASLCPAYALTVFRDGVVEYTGVRDVKVIGKQVASIPVAKVDQLIAEYERTFPRLRSYTRSDCTDQATVTLTFRGQTLNHDYGDAAAPLDLHILETLLDHTTDSQQWTGGPGPFVGACGGASDAAQR